MQFAYLFIILNHPKYNVKHDNQVLTGESDGRSKTDARRESTQIFSEAQFSPDVTPLILAAQHNRFEVVQLLLSRGERIVKPHDFNCKCSVCKKVFKFDSLRLAQSRLFSYSGLASEAYISLASLDPILTAMELSNELTNLAKNETFFQVNIFFFVIEKEHLIH